MRAIGHTQPTGLQIWLSIAPQDPHPALAERACELLPRLSADPEITARRDLLCSAPV